MTLSVRRAAGEADRNAALALRHRVFCQEQGVPVEEEVDGLDAGAVHLLVLEDGAVLGTCRLLMRGATCQLSRMAVEAAARGQGVGAALLRAADGEARRGGARRIALHAQTHAESLYAAHGYTSRGRRFIEAGIEHVAMEKRLG